MCEPPMKPPTSAEFSVIFWSILLLLVGLGAAGLFIGYRAPAEKGQEASKLIWGGYGCIAIGFAMYVVRNILRRI